MTLCLLPFFSTEAAAQTKINWATQIGNFPAACPSNEVVWQIGSTITCVSLTSSYLPNPAGDVTGTYAATVVSGAHLTAYTVATLPAAASNSGMEAVVTDGTSSSDCTTGGGSDLSFCRSNGAAWQSFVASTGGGTVTSVGLAAPTGFSVSGSPVTSSGTLTWAMPSGWTTGDILYGSGSNSVARLGGNTATTTLCLTSTGTGSAAQAPAWLTCPGGITGTGTANTLMKWTGASTAGNSSVTDNGTDPTRLPNGSNTATSGNYQEWTVDTGGTTAGLLACTTTNVDGAGRSKVQTCATGSTTGLVGTAYSTVASGGTVETCWTVDCPAVFDDTPAVGDVATVSSTTAGDLHDSGASAGIAGSQNFTVVVAGASPRVDATGPLANNPKGGGGGKGISTVNGTAPIVASTSGNTATVSCPTCSTGAAIPAAPANLKMAAPIQMPGESVPWSPDPNVYAYLTVPITTVKPYQSMIAGWYLIMYAYFGEGYNGGACSPVESLGNALLNHQNFGFGDVAYVWGPITHTGADSIDLTSCAGNFPPDVGFVEVPTLSSVAFFNNQNTTASTVTTTANSALILGFVRCGPGSSVNQGTCGLNFAEEGGGAADVWAHGLSAFSGYGANGYYYAGYSAPSAGSYAFDVSNLGGGNTGETFVVVYPPVESGTASSASVTGALASVAYTQTITAGQTLVAGIVGGSGQSGTCAATDSNGNAFGSRIALSGFGSQYTAGFVAPVTVGASGGTVTFSAACQATSGNQHGWVVVLPGSYVGYSMGLNQALNPTAWPVQVPAANSIFLADVISTSNSGSFTPAMTNLASGTTGATWTLSGTVLADPESYVITSNTAGAAAETGGLLLAPSAPATWPEQPRVSVASDTPGGVTGQVSTAFTGSPGTMEWKMAKHHSISAILSANVTALSITGLIDGVSYSFKVCQNSTGGYVLAQPNNINVNTWPWNSTAPSTCQFAHATFDATLQELIFPVAGSPVPTIPYSGAAQAPSAGANSLLVHLPIAAGNGNWIYVQAGDNPTVSSVADTAGNTFSLIYTTASVNGVPYEIWAAPVSKGLTANPTTPVTTDTITVTFSGTSFQTVDAEFVTGSSGGTQIVETTGDSTGTITGTASPTVPGNVSLLVFGASDARSSTNQNLTAGTGWTALNPINYSTGSPSLDLPVLEQKTVYSASGTVAPTYSLSTTQHWDITSIVLQPLPYAGPLVGTTASLGGAALLANACSSTTVTVPGARNTMVVKVNPQADPNPANTQDYDWYGQVTSNDTVTVSVCALVAGTPAATTYNVRVIQ